MCFARDRACRALRPRRPSRAVPTQVRMLRGGSAHFSVGVGGRGTVIVRLWLPEAEGPCIADLLPYLGVGTALFSEDLSWRSSRGNGCLPESRISDRWGPY